MKRKAGEMLKSGEAGAVLGWKKGDFPYDPSPALFHSAAELESLVYDGFCGGNLSKYLARYSGGDGKVLVFLKPCDTYSLNQLLGEHRVAREKVYAVGVGCDGMIDIEKLRGKGIRGIEEVEETGDSLMIRTLYGEHVCPREEALLEKCLRCKGKEHQAYDELIGAEDSREAPVGDRFEEVSALEQMSPDERFAFWRGELSKCIRCNACREACPVCSCLTCIFDNARSGVGAKANANDFEENLFHIIRAYHVAGRCTDCGECSRVCPQGIPLHLLNRKFIKDINAFFGEFQAGAGPDQRSPLLSFDQGDADPNAVSLREGAASC
jgi:ferredoxin